MSNTHIALWLAALLAPLPPIPSEAPERPQRIVVRGDADNDLLRVLEGSGRFAIDRCATAADALRRAPSGAAVMILADGYPQRTTPIDAALLDAAREKQLRLYVEYPSSLPGVEVERPVEAHVERAVVSSDFFGEALGKLSIASINGLHYVPVEVASSHLVAARVAGFDRAVFGLPEETSPILFELPHGDVLVATTKLSHFVTGRYAPQDSWRAIWTAILEWLCPEAEIHPLRWTPGVRATYGREERLPADHQLRAIRRGIEWYQKAHMIVHSSFEERVAGVERVGPLPDETPSGDGSLGALEAVISVIHQDGAQSISSVQRGDCTCETAMAMAFGARILRDETRATVARNLLDHYLFDSDARKRERGDPEHGAFGLTAWGITTPAWYRANYGDDNARVILSTLAVAALQGSDRWDEAVMMSLLANLRTTGRLGFRGNRIDVEALGERGWEPYFEGEIVNLAPHFESYLWACYLWAFEQTGHAPFLDRARTALETTMAQYTDGWRWTNGLAQEKARIVLPLAWLVRVEDSPANRAMLRRAVDGLLALQDGCGAIREELGLPGKGVYPPPRSNAAYGTNEASLIAENGDPVADLLYTANFAFLGLHEAAAATGDADLIEAEDRLADFLCRIQVESEAQPAVDGGWFRAFDFERWEHWGCNADLGWGAWCIESGWTQGWITAVLSLREMETSLWELTRGSGIERHFDRLRRQMIPGEAPAEDGPGVSGLSFTYRELEGIGHAPGTCRRDPSDVIRVGDAYHVYYTKVVRAELQENRRHLYPSGYVGTIWCAASTDGLRWAELGEVLGPGESGSWDSHAVFTPNILEHGGRYWLYYTGVRPTAGRDDGLFENNSTDDVTAIGVAVGDAPGGPFERVSPHPILAIGRPKEAFDSYRVDDACLALRGGKVWLYYKGRSASKGAVGPRHTQMGVAVSASPAGPFERLEEGRSVQDSGHEVQIWQHGEGILSLVSPTGPNGRTLQCSEDGVRFEVLLRELAGQPNAPGMHRPELTGSEPTGRPSWGVGMIHGRDPHLVRFDCEWSAEPED